MTKSPALAAHACRFNDGPHVCECFVAGQKANQAEVERLRGALEWLRDNPTAYIPDQQKQIRNAIHPIP